MALFKEMTMIMIINSSLDPSSKKEWKILTPHCNSERQTWFLFVCVRGRQTDHALFRVAM